jgi:hypothetical protein
VFLRHPLARAAYIGICVRHSQSLRVLELDFRSVPVHALPERVVQALRATLMAVVSALPTSEVRSGV